MKGKCLICLNNMVNKKSLKKKKKKEFKLRFGTNELNFLVAKGTTTAAMQYYFPIKIGLSL